MMGSGSISWLSVHVRPTGGPYCDIGAAATLRRGMEAFGAIAAQILLNPAPNIEPKPHSRPRPGPRLRLELQCTQALFSGGTERLDLAGIA